MVVKEIRAKSILSASKVYPYVLNPYVGCQFGCLYCYARFMKKFTGHTEPWGSFVDVKVNAPELLERELKRKKPDEVWISGVCDPDVRDDSPPFAWGRTPNTPFSRSGGLRIRRPDELWVCSIHLPKAQVGTVSN